MVKELQQDPVLYFAKIEYEMKLLVLLLYNPRLIKKVADRLKPEHFYRDINACMYEIALDCYHANRRCTADTMRYELEKRGRLEEAVEHGQLTMLQSNAEPDSLLTLGDIEAYATVIMEEATYRQLSFASSQIMELAAKRDPDAVQQAMEIVSDIALGIDSKPSESIADVADRYMAGLDQRRADLKNNIASGIPTGFSELDRMLGGLQPSRLYTLAALTGFGKSSFAWQVALNIGSRITMNSKRALFFSLEMDNEELVQRALSMEAEIDQKSLESGDLDEESYQRVKIALKTVKQCDLKMNDRAYTIAEITNLAKKEHAEKPLSLIVVDYVQLVESPGEKRQETRAEELGKLSRGLKRLARTLKVPVLALAQVNRKVEERKSGTPMLSDINESGGIARDSDCVLFLYVDGEDQENVKKRESSMTCTFYIKAAKHRNGRLGEVPLLFAPRITKFRTHPGVGFEETPDDQS